MMEQQKLRLEISPPIMGVFSSYNGGFPRYEKDVSGFTIRIRELFVIRRVHHGGKYCK
jgi:hypothetical protein